MAVVDEKNSETDNAVTVKSASASSVSSADDSVTLSAPPPYNKPKSIIGKVMFYINPFSVHNVPPIPTSPEPNREATANWASKLYFVWMNKTLRAGYGRPIHENDIPEVGDSRRAAYMTDKFLDHFSARLAKGQRKNVLLRALFDTFRFELSLSLTCRCITDTIWMTAPQLSRKIIYFVADEYEGLNPPIGHGVGMIIGLVCLLLISMTCQQQYFYSGGMAGSEIRTTLINAIYRKSLVLSNKSRTDYTNGKITNLMSTDTFRIEFSCMFIAHVVDAPIPLIICLILLVVNIGPSALCGYALLIIVSPLLGKITQVIARRRVKSTVFTDQRIRLVQELLQNMRIIKFFAWENSYIQRLLRIRKREIHFIRYVLTLRSSIFAISMALPVFASMISFVILSVSGHYLDPAKIFASLTLFNMLRIPLMVIPLGLSTGTDAYVALQRIQELLIADELDSSIVEDSSLDCAISVENASFVWDAESDNDSADKKAPAKKEKRGLFSRVKKSKKPTAAEIEEENENKLTRAVTSESAAIIGMDAQIENEKGADSTIIESPEEVVEQDPEDPEAVAISGLHNLNFKINPGEFVVIMGFIGSGKTSLLASMVGEMRQTSGSVKMNGTVAYCPQPWIQNSTLRENILFGREYEEQKYQDVIKGCALEHDLKVLPAGDRTEIGERGINISGGQKSRITLARAAYYDADIVLMDDVLSAVDPHVGKHLVEQCICGLLKNSTRLLATHQLHVLPYVDRIIFMDGAGGMTLGTYEELMISCPKFAELIAFGSENKKNEEEDDETDSADKKDDVTEETSEAKDTSKDNGKSNAGVVLMTKEEVKNSASVPFKVWKTYFHYAGGKFLGWSVAPIILTIAILGAGCQIITNLWLSYWTQDKFGMTRGAYIGVFVMLGIVAAIFFFLLGWATSMAGSKASVNMNMKATEKVIQAPMSFFDTTPLGRIINRFSNDVESMDNTLIDAYRMFLSTTCSICGTLILIIAYLYWFVIALVPLLVIFMWTISFYRATNVDIKRMDSNARSSVFSHFSETLTGLTSVRAYHEQHRFQKRMEDRLDYMNRFSYFLVGNQRWLSIRLESIAVCLVFVMGMLAVAAHMNVSSSSIGLVLSYCMGLSMQMSMVIKQLADVETHMNASERVYHYMTELPSEAAFEIEDAKPRASWPENGSIEIDNVYLQYRPGLPHVLRGLTVSIQGGEKVGICGRTGAGKSSIMVALYRLAEMTSGKIVIDGVDISQIGLHDLRSKLAIIPQDPVLFKGTIRSNLDPFNMYDDAALWDALRRAGLLNSETSETESEIEEKDRENHQDPITKFQLDSSVDDEGGNFSLGERQLLALARALVRSFQILVLDEATSSVDYATDAKIQDIIVREFSRCTILCIAHRLKTIVNYDKILVLDAGQVCEFGEPKTLFEKEGGVFREMCLKSKIVESDFH
ncbi:P-loop containing nucleoside triphosphate hydrolase protein [Lipomyces oligophaga]|uniref:P-loop containing nucleoside triphosphate hydrolase protein n=1 Tax=Lipomyces oligophaga TaxID=45792 RepID=UPI0034CDF84C